MTAQAEQWHNIIFALITAGALGTAIMSKIIQYFLAGLFIALKLTGPALAEAFEDMRFYNKTGAFEDVRADVEDAIIDRGFVVDYNGKIAKMLERTGKATGSEKLIYNDAEFFQFCSATLSRKMMEADPRNIGNCPFVITIYELAAAPGTIYVGYRAAMEAGSKASRDALAAVNKMLDEIAREATK